MSNIEQQLLLRKDRILYIASKLFFPPKVRDDFTRLYAFMRKADCLVNAVPQLKDDFFLFRKNYELALQNREKGMAHWQSGDMVVDDFILLAETYAFLHNWTTSFLDSMEANLTKTTYFTLDETLGYMYGSAEVVGLYLCQLFHLPQEAHYAAQMLGRSMQYINFIRDIKEDNLRGRQYIPVSEVDKYKLPMLTETTSRHAPKQFNSFIIAQIRYYKQWQKEAVAGFRYVPKPYRIVIKTAADMYRWTSKQIERNPLIIFEKKIMLPNWLLIFRILVNMITA